MCAPSLTPTEPPAVMRRACYRCIYRRDIPGDAHSSCMNLAAHVVGDLHGAMKGWFFWPFNFDPVWLLHCDGFTEKRDARH